MLWKSFAEWPDNVYTDSYGTHISDDTHAGKDEAIAVCRMLERDGYGGMGKHYPIRTWTEEKKP